MHTALARRSCVKRCSTVLFAVTIVFGLGACSPARTTSTGTPSPIATTLPAQPALASDPAVLGADLAADEQTLRDPSSPEGALVSAALRQQAAYRAIGRHPEWEATARGKIPASLVGAYDRNVSARHHLTALNRGEAKDTLPAWRIESPAPADVLLGLYHDAEAASGVGWNYLAAINLVETGFGRIIGPSTAGAQGPMQFLPSTFASYGNGGDIASPHDSILAAGRFLAANGFASDHDRAIFAYNHSGEYVGAINDYAAVLAGDPAAFAGYYRWDIYYFTTSGDVLLPVGYAQSQRIPVADYLASHPQ
ncbi:lytic transglycosylase [Mycobacterium sp. 852002-51163_SCH5372311]|uniref:lytic transglycosylase domain-containing protein n=1 Tax=Mycobacterium sp. 852002-51163_SCH5372311 TaxID=1834097 RepID=UPI0007FD43BF|nr:lytic transglycosylase domain-containing protein [Mycobacterium sp. 852002-51163_SCH5372311]OBF81200.1 lytic transglycosylase [Mycobacterium sp. 852002-51163_SCH5372311]